jgi:hypothetical protein
VVNYGTRIQRKSVSCPHSPNLFFTDIKKIATFFQKIEILVEFRKEKKKFPIFLLIKIKIFRKKRKKKKSINLG